jgi:hypothetical protein
MSALAEAGIRLPHERPAKHRLPCPECDKGRSDTALQVTVTAQRWAFWKCWRCPWEGKAPLDEERPVERPSRPLQLAEPESAPRPSGLTAKAQALLRSCRPITAGSPPSNYFQGRGCVPPENNVLWHPTLQHPSGHVGPGIVAIVTDVLTGERINLHRTWLKPDGSGKAEIDKPRLLLKGHRKHGGVVRLWPDEEVSTGLCIAEGLETALTTAHGFTPVWACIDAGNLAAFPVLPGIESLTIVADHDKPNPKTGKRAGIEAAEACAERWLSAEKEVRIWRAGTEGQDFNDWFTGAAA